MNSSIIIGVVSGLLASAIGLIIRNVWLNVVKPAYEDAIYKDAKIEGKWHGSHVDNYGELGLDEEVYGNQYIMEISRSGHAIQGSIVGTSGGDEGRVYELTGTFRNLIVAATFESKNRQYIERGCLNLMVKKNGNQLEGYYTNYEDNNHEVFASRIVFNRNSA